MKSLKKEIASLKEAMKSKGIELSPMSAASFALQSIPDTVQPFYQQFHDYLEPYRGRKLSQKLKIALADKFMSSVYPEYQTMTRAQRIKYMDLLLLDDF